MRRAVTQPMGFSPGVAARLTLEDDRRIFVKAVGSELNPDSAGIHRREIRIVSALPASAPVPRVLWSHDEGEGGWVALAFEDIDGAHPKQPWDPAELERVLAELSRLSDSLTPSLLPPGLARSPADAFAEHRVSGWRALQKTTAGEVERLEPWFRANLARLAELEAGVGEAAAGDSLVHFDIRADNLLLTPERVWFFDWPHALVGAPWIDLLLFAPSVTMQGGPPPEEIVSGFPPYRDADPERVTAVLAAFSGYFTLRAMRPPPPGLPTLRAFQAAQGVVAREWLRRRLA